MTVLSLLVLLIGAALGVVTGYLLGRGSQAGVRADVAAQASAAEERARAAEQRAALLDGQLAERFRALSAQVVDASTRNLVELATSQLSAANARAGAELESRRVAVDSLVSPLRETLARVEEQLRKSDMERQAAQAALAQQMTDTRQTADELRQQTQALVTALRRPEARGRWGEMQLRRVAELAGMIPQCDFDEQAAVETGDGTVRPDMVVRLAGGRNIVVDAKVSLAAYLEAAEASDETLRQARLGAHARHLREHVDRLAAKEYWTALSPAPEFVVLFIPGEAFLAPALDHDPGLLEYAVRRKVHIATPMTFVTMLRTAQYAWQQAKLADNARAVFDLGQRLYKRLSDLGHHVDDLGRALSKAVKSYNQTVGSLESRVLVTARQLHELGVVEGEVAQPAPVEEAARPLSAPELIAVTAALPPCSGDTPASGSVGLPAIPGQANGLFATPANGADG
jgi:DNA recombination protein RmuC